MGLFSCVPKPLKMLFDVASLQSGKIEAKKSREFRSWRKVPKMESLKMIQIFEGVMPKE
jgi:hypothetical protein